MRTYKTLALWMSMVLIAASCVPGNLITAYGAENGAVAEGSANKEDINAAIPEAELSGDADAVTEFTDEMTSEKSDMAETAPAETDTHNDKETDAAAAEEGAAAAVSAEEAAPDAEGEEAAAVPADGSATGAKETAGDLSVLPIEEPALEEADGSIPANSYFTPLERDFYLAEEFGFGDVRKVEITEPDGYVLLRFVPEETTGYVFYSSNASGIPMVIMFDSDCRQMDVDYGESEGDNFSIKHVLSAGETYYYALAMHDTGTGTFDVQLKKESDFSCEPAGATTRYITLYEEHTLKVNAVSSAPIRYQWYFNDPDNVIEGATTSSLTFTALEKGTYCCAVTDEDGNYELCRFYIEIVNDLKLTDPDGYDYKYVAPGGTIELKTAVSAIDTSNLTYEWYETDGLRLGDQIEGAVSSSLTVGPLYSDAGYVCFVYDRFGNHDQCSFDIKVGNNLAAEAVQDYLKNSEWYFVTVKAGESADLSVRASALDMSGITYRWYVDGKAIEGASSADFVLDPVTRSGIYTVNVSDRYGNSVSCAFNVKIDNDFKAYKEGETPSTGGYYNVYVPLNSPAELKVAVSGYDTGGVNYKWSHDEETVGTNAASFTTGPVTGPEIYRCDVTDKYGTTYDLIFKVFVDNLTVYIDGYDENTDKVFLKVAPGSSAVLKVITRTKYEGQLYFKWGSRLPDDPVCRDQHSDTLTIDSVTSENYYYCEISDDYGNVKFAHFYLEADNHLTAHPEGAEHTNSVTVYAQPGERAVLRAVVSANDESGLIHRWYIADSGVWPHPEITGANSTTYTTDSITEAHRYEYSVSDQYGNSVTLYFSVQPRINVELHPEGSEDPYVSIDARTGESITLRAVVNSTHTDSLTYQWYYNNQPIEGADSTSYTTGPVVEGFNTYSFEVRDPYGFSTRIYYTVCGISGGVEIQAANISGITDKVSTGSPVTQKVVVRIGNAVLVKDTDYTVTYSDNTKVGKATVTITGIGKYSGSVTKTFQILPGASTKVTLTNVASGIKVAWNKVDGAKYYKVYRGNQLIFTTSQLFGTDTGVKTNNGTKYTYKVVASTTKSNATGDSPKSRTATGYRLIPVGIKSLSNPAAGKMTVTYDKNAKSSGYVVRFGQKSDMSDAKVITVSGANTTSRTFSGLVRGKTYYVQVRTYRIENGVRYYSGYCTTKTVRITR